MMGVCGGTSGHPISDIDKQITGLTRQIILLIESLDAGWVQHNTDAMSHSLWWQVLGELCADDAGVTMGTEIIVQDSNYR